MTVHSPGLIVAALSALLVASTSCYPNPQPEGLTPVPTLQQGRMPTGAPQVTTPPTPASRSMGQLVPFVPEIQTAVAPPVSTGTAQGSTPAPVGVGANQIGGAVGSALYMESCLCHGSQGQGISAPPLRNSQYVQVAGDQTLYTTVAFGRNNTRMPAWLLGQCGPLTDAQIMSVVGYLHSLQNVPVLPTATLGLPPVTPTRVETAEAARPATPGSPGAAVNLTGDVAQGRAAFGPNCAGCHGPEGLQGVANPGSVEGRVPVLNPIDPDIASSDLKVFATSVDLRVQNGRIPVGSAPELVMPAFGERNLLSQQQIADIIAYVIYLNQTCPGLSCS